MLVVTDDFSWFPEFEILRSTSAKAVIPHLDSIFARQGIPEVVRTDNGPPFKSESFRKFATHLGFTHPRITPEWPRANGEAERPMKTLEQAITTAVVQGKNWKQQLFIFLRQHRANPHSTTGKSPSELLNGRKLKSTLPPVQFDQASPEIRQADANRKEKMKEDADKYNHAKTRTSMLATKYLLFLQRGCIASNFDPSSVTAFVEIHKSSEAKLVFPDITVRQTQQLIEAIPSGKATGVDGMSARLLKIAAPAIAPSLTRLINKCISNGVFPTVWKEAKVTPLHKGESKSEINNYRPISVLPVLSKIFERHLHNSLYEYLCSNILLYNMQSGFRKFFSTETALVNMFDKMLWNLDKNCINGLILADFQKAFDLVDHEIMIQKLQIYGLEETSLELLRSYLSNRKQRTVIGNVYSSSQSLTHGVPQGSVLAPLLFLIFINDLAETMPSKTTVDIFADDTTLSASAPFTDITGFCAKLCESTQALETWTKNNRFKLNTGKTKSMVVSGSRLSPTTGDMGTEMEIRTKEGVVLEQTTSHKLLGVHIDQDLSFNDHVDYMCKKLAQRIETLRSIRHYLPLNERLTFYNAIIKPVMMYGGLIWGPPPLII
ncbi:hypothetical protein ACROYT_G008349 [Oculina patagonica]